MAKNCYGCKHLEFVHADDDCNSGWDCIKRHTIPMNAKAERELLMNMDSEAYRNRYKRCFEATPTTDAPQAMGSGDACES